MAKNKSKKKKEPDIQEIRLPIKFNISDDIVTRFVTNLVVQSVEGGFRISFFEIFQDIMLGEIKKEDIPKEIQANCVASIVVPHEKLPSFIRAMDENYKKYLARKDREIPPNP